MWLTNVIVDKVENRPSLSGNFLQYIVARQLNTFRYSPSSRLVLPKITRKSFGPFLSLSTIIKIKQDILRKKLKFFIFHV